MNDPTAPGGASAAAEPTQALILDFLESLAAEPQPYAEVMEAWRTSCPKRRRSAGTFRVSRPRLHAFHGAESPFCRHSDAEADQVGSGQNALSVFGCGTRCNRQELHA